MPRRSGRSAAPRSSARSSCERSTAPSDSPAGGCFGHSSCDNPPAVLFRRFKRAPWWVHVLTGVALLAVVNGIALAVAGALYLDYTRESGPPSSEIPPQSAVDAEERMELARRFAPVLRYHTGEPFVPISRSAYVSRTQLKEQEGRFVRLLNASPAEDQLP